MHNNYFDCVKSRDDGAGETGDEWMVAGTLSIPKRPAMSSSSLDEMRPGVIKTEGALLSSSIASFHPVLCLPHLHFVPSLLLLYTKRTPIQSTAIAFLLVHSNQLLLLLYHHHRCLSPLHSLLCLCILVVHDVAYKFRSIDRNRMLHC